MQSEDFRDSNSASRKYAFLSLYEKLNHNDPAEMTRVQSAQHSENFDLESSYLCQTETKRQLGSLQENRSFTTEATQKASVLFNLESVMQASSPASTNTK